MVRVLLQLGAMISDRVSFADSLELDARNGRRVVVTRVAIPAGAVVSRMRGELREEPSRWSLQVDHGLHLGESGWTYDEMCHSCEATCYVDLSQRGDPKIRAIRDLAPGDETTLNYCATEEDLAEPFPCECGSASCYGVVRGFRHLTADQRRAILEILAPHLRRIYTDLAPPMGVGSWTAPELAAGAA